ncbi:MAG: hypothetical protein HOC63_09650 [Rhodospirillales bacterium]|nr:hypothetical protein [Rhodospirillales bacterium]MBT4039231.1 hypothetical protein [Rhodospirillales bacterium]MBT4626941.1 hypothetical protein [Rhodospirillales bacterium]MBT5350170.1 hypothetical protein [Rhodospirillales bacterium]MBT5521082.1 hypothetical protein [Rhodospirillales bacterium]
MGNRLEELGQSREKLVSVAEAMIGAKADCTDNDPPGARGWSAWRMGTRRLREVNLVDDGWEKDETDQVSSVLNRNLGVRIVVSNTNDCTGIEEVGRNPQNRSKKGAATDRMIQQNQGSFMDILDATTNIIPLHSDSTMPGAIVTWYYCVYCEGDDFRTELSCPSSVENGFFAGFIERIFIIDSSNDGTHPTRRLNDDETVTEFEIPVTRK